MEIYVIGLCGSKLLLLYS